MSLTVQRPMTIREQGRVLFADFPEVPNGGYFFSHFQESDGSTVWCRANRTARGGPIYHFVKILNPQDPENREFRVIDTTQLDLLERRQFRPFENFLLDREGELALQEMDLQTQERRRTFAVIREQQADIRQGLTIMGQQQADIRQGLTDMGQQQADMGQQQANIWQQQADIRQQHATLERQIGALEQQNAYFRASNSRKDALIEQIQTSRAPQVVLGAIGQTHTTHVASSVQQIATSTVNSPDFNAILSFSPSETLPSAHGVVSSSPMSNHLSTPNSASPFHPVINQAHQASAPRNEPALQTPPLSSLSPSNSPRIPFTSQPHQQQAPQQESRSTPLVSSTNPNPLVVDSSVDGNTHSNQDNNDLSVWQKIQEGISSLFAQFVSRIKQGWESFISLF